MSQEQIDRLHAAVADGLAANRDATEGLGSSDANLVEIVLVGLANAIQDHTAAIMHLVEDGHMRSSIVLLRTLIEAWISARYVAADPAGKRAAAYLMNGPRATARYFSSLLRLVTETPSEKRTALASAGMTTVDDLKERIKQLDEELDRAKQNGVPYFPNVFDCAKAVGLQVTYRSVYGFLFSEVVHAGARDTLRDQFGGADHKVLITTFHIQVEILELTSAHFNRPDKVTLDAFRTQLTELADDNAVR